MTYNKEQKLHIVACVAVIRNLEGKYLVLKRSEREIAYPGMYTFPGGKVEGNQTIEESLAEEVMEEAGLKLKPGKILLKDKSFLRPDGQTAKYLSYLCEVEECEPVEIDKNDFSDYRWVNLEDLKNIPHVGIEDELIQAEKIISSNVNLDLLKTKSVKDSALEE